MDAKKKEKIIWGSVMLLAWWLFLIGVMWYLAGLPPEETNPQVTLREVNMALIGLGVFATVGLIPFMWSDD